MLKSTRDRKSLWAKLWVYLEQRQRHKAGWISVCNISFDSSSWLAMVWGLISSSEFCPAYHFLMANFENTQSCSKDQNSIIQDHKFYTSTFYFRFFFPFCFCNSQDFPSHLPPHYFRRFHSFIESSEQKNNPIQIIVTHICLRSVTYQFDRKVEPTSVIAREMKRRHPHR